MFKHPGTYVFLLSCSVYLFSGQTDRLGQAALVNIFLTWGLYYKHVTLLVLVASLRLLEAYFTFMIQVSLALVICVHSMFIVKAADFFFVVYLDGVVTVVDAKYGLEKVRKSLKYLLTRLQYFVERIPKTFLYPNLNRFSCLNDANICENA